MEVIVTLERREVVIKPVDETLIEVVAVDVSGLTDVETDTELDTGMLLLSLADDTSDVEGTALVDTELAETSVVLDTSEVLDCTLDDAEAVSAVREEDVPLDDAEAVLAVREEDVPLVDCETGAVASEELDEVLLVAADDCVEATTVLELGEALVEAGAEAVVVFEVVEEPSIVEEVADWAEVLADTVEEEADEVVEDTTVSVEEADEVEVVPGMPYDGNDVAETSILDDELELEVTLVVDETAAEVGVTALRVIVVVAV